MCALTAINTGRLEVMNIFFIIGACIFVTGLYIEIKADNQKSRFRSIPENREFFFQYCDLFSGFGDIYENQPFFTRRIGVTKDINGNTIQNKIHAGIRLSGKLTNKLRVGLLNMQTAEDEMNLIPSNNNTVLSFQQSIFSKSNFKFLFVNRQKTSENNSLLNQEKYNRVLGFDYNFISKDDKIRGKVFFYNTFSPSVNKEGFSTGGWINYNTRKNRFRTAFFKTTPNFTSDLGFTRRTDFKKNYTSYNRVFYPKSKSIQSIEFGPQLYYIDKPGLKNQVTDRRFSANLSFNFKNTSGDYVSLNDEQFKNRVVVVQIMGTWCPNCLDETQFFLSYIKDNPSTDIAFVALSFEAARTEKKAMDRIQLMVDRFDIPYPVLLAQFGSVDTKIAQEKLPMLKEIRSYPTTIIIDKSGKVNSIHTGFNGPATGKAFEDFKMEFDEEIKSLVSN